MLFDLAEYKMQIGIEIVIGRRIHYVVHGHISLSQGDIIYSYSGRLAEDEIVMLKLGIYIILMGTGSRHGMRIALGFCLFITYIVTSSK